MISLAGFFDKYARAICASIIILPMALMGLSTFWKMGPRWLSDNHPMRALLVVLIVLAIAWASQSVEIGKEGSTFWVVCIGCLFLIFLTIGTIEILGFEEWIDRARDPVMIAILVYGPIVLIASRLRLRVKGYRLQGSERQDNHL